MYIYILHISTGLHKTFYTSYIIIHAYIFIDVEDVIYIYACVCIGSNLHGDITTKYTVKWFLTWNDDDKNDLVGGLEHVLSFHILGISSSQLLLTPSFFRGVGQPPTSDWLIFFSRRLTWQKRDGELQPAGGWAGRDATVASRSGHGDGWWSAVEDGLRMWPRGSKNMGIIVTTWGR